MIEICRISHAFDGRSVLREISLSLAERRIAIIGANGLVEADGKIRVTCEYCATVYDE